MQGDLLHWVPGAMLNGEQQHTQPIRGTELGLSSGTNPLWITPVPLGKLVTTLCVQQLFLL